MAEIVQRHCENMIKELEDLSQTKLMSEDMIRRIIVARKHMEAKINANYSKNIDDYKSYIKHEMLVLEKVRKSRDKKKISEKKSSVDYSIVKRIRRLYELALQKFPSDYSIHEGFYKFCKENSFNTTASQAVDNMLKLFSYRPEVWKLAAGWYCHLNDFNKALQTLHKGLTVNPESTLLYSSAIEMELSQVTNVDCSPEEKAFKENKCCEKLKTYANLILNNIRNLEYIITTLTTLEGHSFTTPAQQMIVEHLFKYHDKEEIVWHMLARREKKGIHFVTDLNERGRSTNFKESCLMYCIDKYTQGLEKVDEDRKRKLWSYYLETLIEIKEETNAGIKEEGEAIVPIDGKQLLKSALEQAHRERCLEERHYTVWVSIVEDEVARNILREATEIYPESEELWKIQLRYAIITDKVDKVNVTFKLGVSALKEKALNLWLMVLRFHSLISEDEKIKSIFEDGVKQPFEISNVLKPRYIEWLALHDGIDAARDRYRTLAIDKPYCKELHLLMSKLELSQMKIDQPSWQKVHELACEQFGEEDVDVWINFIKFILFMKSDECQDKISSIYAEAKEKLPPLMWQQFKELYDKVLAES